MKIIAPVNDVREARMIIEAGADEIYCGVFPKASVRQYDYVAFPNTRSPKGNLKSYADLREVVSIAHHNGVPVFLTLNGNGYTQRLYPMVFEQIRQAKKCGVDALIVVDLGLLLTIKKERTGLDIHMGTASVSFNSQSVKFYEDLGASRIVLPRDMRLDEIKALIKECPSVRFEVIILRSGCRYIDGFCWFSHHLEDIFGSFFARLKGCAPRKDCFACELEYKLSFFGDKRIRRSVKENIVSFPESLSRANACGVCKLSKFHKMGLYGVKIAGRGHSIDQKVNDIRFVKMSLSVLEAKDSRRVGFDDSVKKAHRQIFGVDCKRTCYYPQGR